MTSRVSPVLSLDDLLAGTKGRALSQVAKEFSGVGTDTRTDLTGQIFIALKGDSFDAHEFLTEAAAKGAAVLVVHRLPEKAQGLLKTMTIVEVEDTLLALQNLGNFWRRKMPARVLGLTGTNGKTTTKEFTASLLGANFRVQYSRGSLNNHWGVPLSLLAISPSDQIAVIEMGMNHLGELTRLSSIAEPDVVMVTMVGRGHLEGLGSIEGVAKAKAEVYEAAKKDAQFCFNLDNPFTHKMYERYGSKDRSILTFSGHDPKADVQLQLVSMDEMSLLIRGTIAGAKGEAKIPVFGVQNLTNLMAAATLALAAGMSGEQIWQEFPRCHTVWGRNQWVRLPSGARVLFDGYNANPESMQAALDNFAQLNCPARKFAVLGEMREMGSHASEVHRAIGERAASCGFSGICFLGPSGASFEAGLKAGGVTKNLFISDTYEQSLASRMLPVLHDKDLVLMKGSRGMQLEKVLLDWHPLDFHADH